jgi:hypothetical protein
MGTTISVMVLVKAVETAGRGSSARWTGPSRKGGDIRYGRN